MIIDNLKDEFYETISCERILVLVALDVDALCACKIVKLLFKQDNIQYTIIPVSGVSDLKSSYDEHREQIKHFLLLNCGGNIDLDILEPDDDTTFYIVDSHRPLDLNNVFKEQVKILIKEGDSSIDEIPEPEKVIEYEGDDEEEDEDNEDSDDPDQPSSKRQRTGEDLSYLEKKVKKKKWAAERDRILDEYYECSYYGNSVATVLYDLAWKLTKDSNDLLWLSIVGLTEQYLMSKIDRERYFEEYTSLRDHVLRHNITDEEHAQSIDCVKISFENELRLDLYRHWSLFQSFMNSQYTSCGFRLFTMKGKKRLHELFADMGLPIKQCQQKFSSMDADLRGNVKEWIDSLAEKYGLDDLSYGSFVAQYGYRSKLCAGDVVFAISALLEYAKDGSTYSDHFLDAMDALTRSNVDKLIEGIELGKQQITSMVNQVRSFIDSHQIVCAGPFLYVHVQDGSPNAPIFANPIVITRLARYSLEAYSIMAKNKKARTLPFVLAVPYNAEEGTSLLVGVPPVSDTSFKSFFGAAFKQAGEKTKSRVKHDFFDPTVIEIKTEDRSKFFDNLSALMA
ncbi:cell division control protein 45 homolog isoform X1 [Hydractinia symbiolongicarpus]|uniref:cell division control protein 45 homolog isoform X1 n=1 Tax=Hydractinia symbiolongicarpus TaxID=13093 RepID=UPI00254E0217|nr:cell division control protein 45 homolog isoform X1 [Hydractinia symbiolongicarpus]